MKVHPFPPLLADAVAAPLAVLTALTAGGKLEGPSQGLLLSWDVIGTLKGGVGSSLERKVASGSIIVELRQLCMQIDGC